MPNQNFMKKYPLVTVLMSAYNGEKYLAEAIDSILNQTYKNFEFLIIDDGSTDRTSPILEDYSKQDKRILVLKNKENIGLTKSLNIGIKIAKGKYIARMDADDISFPERFEKQVLFMENNLDVVVCGAWAEVFDDKNKYLNKTPITNEAIKAALFFTSALIHSSVILRMDVMFKKQLMYNENCTYAQDYELWCRMAPKYKFANIPQVLVKYRDHLGNISSKNKTVQDKISFGISLNQLQNLLSRKSFSDLELGIHKVILGMSKEHYINIKDLIDWVLLLWKTNRIEQQYNDKYFKKYLTFAWKTALKNSKKNLFRQILDYLYLFSMGKVNFRNFIFFAKLSSWCCMQKICLYL